MGLRSLRVESLALEAGDVARLAAALPELDVTGVTLPRAATAAATAAPAPLSWPLPPALRHLSLEFAEVAALAALRPPASLEVLAISNGHMELTVNLTALADDGGHLRGEAAPIGHAAWMSELRPMGLRALRLERLALEAGDMVQLAAAVPELEELSFRFCQLPPDALLVLRHLPRLRWLEILDWDEFWPDEMPEETLRCQLLGLCAGEAGAPDLSLRFGTDEKELRVCLRSAVGWVTQQLPLLRCHRRVEAEVGSF
ncbi:hypothetical protein GPECTOR_16g734 [Gonium pectorale]|uniref:F-box domain-containing protein n=1 Tax=Gonium pectorale TaxID=33097 RepID=A0A150GL32_GONPE|nr:hypothetical protein GPECTOR_16g734 [Gonium pectorale]|eukprot:KXZ50559.1 hypothetical protein GPECTOR_16g734 [Gonium pectorale]